MLRSSPVAPATRRTFSPSRGSSRISRTVRPRRGSVPDSSTATLPRLPVAGFDELVGEFGARGRDQALARVFVAQEPRDAGQSPQVLAGVSLGADHSEDDVHGSTVDGVEVDAAWAQKECAGLFLRLFECGVRNRDSVADSGALEPLAFDEVLFESGFFDVQSRCEEL